MQQQILKEIEQQILKEIERLNEDEYQSETYEQSSGYYDALNKIKSFVENMQEEENTSDLHDAAYAFACECHPLKTDCSTTSPNPEIEKAVMFGAKFQKEKMLKDAIDIKINRDVLYDLKQYIHERYLDLKIGEKVKLILLKEDEYEK